MLDLLPTVPSAVYAKNALPDSMLHRPTQASDYLVFLFLAFLLLIVLLWIESHRRFYRANGLAKARRQGPTLYGAATPTVQTD
jgi:hypothetical protein